jgi:hypothetical protein
MAPSRSPYPPSTPALPQSGALGDASGPVRSSHRPSSPREYSATRLRSCLAPALYESATLHRRGRISRQGLAEHRDALMGIAWGLAAYSPGFAQRDAELRARGMSPIQARVAIARNACRLAYRLLVTQQPFDEEAYLRGRLSRGR